MILLDTHVWVWWVHGDERLGTAGRERLEEAEARGFGVSIFSCWEVAKLVERQRLDVGMPIEEWLHLALSYPGIRLIPLTPVIVVESTRLPGDFHRDPADQLIVATARVLEIPLATADEAILEYTHVQTVAMRS